MSIINHEKDVQRELARLKQEKARKLENDLVLMRELPHLYRFKEYRWSQEFIDSRNHKIFLCAANQIGKSSSQIKKYIKWATTPSLWAELWSDVPNLFWYLYPTRDVVNYEYETKWLGLLPSGKHKDHPLYGWQVIKDGKNIMGMRFNSGILLLFKTYAQDVSHLQSGTVYAIGADEELPFHLWDELKFRINATRGYFSMAFTATIGQEEWRCTMEEVGTKKERFKGAHKINASLYDSQFYVDGSPSRWTDERIQEVIADCSSDEEVQKRVFGRFALGAQRKISSFNPKIHCKEKIPLTKQWQFFTGIDYGSGGKTGHPAAVLTVGVNPEFTKAVVKKAWKGDETYRTDSGYILNKAREQKRDLNIEGFEIIHPAKYDFAAADLAIIAADLGEALNKADKSRDKGIGVIETLFKNDMLELDVSEPYVSELSSELMTIKDDAKVKGKKGDDLFDALRYALCDVPFNWTLGAQLKAMFHVEQKPKKALTEEQIRRGHVTDIDEVEYSIQEEFDEFEDMLNG